MADKPKLRIIDDASVREAYFNKFIGLISDGTGTQITLGSQRVTQDRLNVPLGPDNRPVVHVTGRIVLSPEATVELANALNNLLQVMAKPADPLKSN